jgi:hypothetical protein
VMQRNAAVATAMAQKIITRTMSIASHGVPMVQNSRIVIAWLPTFGTALADIERRSLAVLRKMEPGKRIGWVGGNYAQIDAEMHPEGGISALSTQPPSDLPFDEQLPSLPGIINQIEREMFGSDGEKSLSKAQRPMRVLHNPQSADESSSGRQDA